MDVRIESVPEADGTFRPVAVWFGRRRVPVLAVLDTWYGPAHRWCKVDTAEGQYVLRRDEASGTWELAAVVGA